MAEQQQPVRAPIKGGPGGTGQGGVLPGPVPGKEGREVFTPADSQSGMPSSTRITLPSSSGQDLYNQWEVTLRDLQAATDRAQRADREQKEAHTALEEATRLEERASSEFRNWMRRQR